MHSLASFCPSGPVYQASRLPYVEITHVGNWGFENNIQPGVYCSEELGLNKEAIA